MRVLLFDIDGTLLLTGGAGTRAINKVFRDRYGLADAMRGVRAGGKTDPMILQEIFQGRLGRTAEMDEIRAIIDVYEPLLEIELARAEGFRVMPGAIEIVRGLVCQSAQSGWSLGLATGNTSRAARHKLARIGLWECFRFGGFGDDAAERAALVAIAIQRAGAVDPADVLVIGDTPFDVLAARACGAQVIVLPTGSYTRAELEACNPDAVLDTLHELPGYLSR